ncbi:MAG: DUF1254 domain-containing protein [Okeania sp. SIO2C2]|nr:DUF1254 domain-containing protein [Okeania sp. SIO2C2]
MQLKRQQIIQIFVVACAILLLIVKAPFAIAEVPPDVRDSISTPDEVDTSIGTLHFFDGVPTPETTETVYDDLDRMRGTDAFLKGIPLASVYGLMEGQYSLGATAAHQVIIFDQLMDSESLYLTANTSTLYTWGVLDLKRDGATVIDVPPGMLGMINDAAFDWIVDIGPAGPDEGNGGKFLVLPPDFEGAIPEGYFVVPTKAYRHSLFLRTSIADGIDQAANLIKNNLKVYPFSQKDNPPAMEFVSASGKAFNTVHANNFKFYEELDAVIQYEPYGLIDRERRGLFASIGIEKGKAFAPDARMEAILTDAVAIGNAAARSIVWYPRVDGTLQGVQHYPDTDSSWLMGYTGRNVFFTGEDGETMNSDARVMFHYPYTYVSPAMATPQEGTGSDYGVAYLDSNKQFFDGSKTYQLHIPADPPAKDFWAVTIYDSQTRSMLQTGQPFPTVGSQTEGIQQNADGSTDVYFCPQPPTGYENNWLETVPGKSWFVIFRMYGPLQPWLDQSWRPGEVELLD